jgi:hypothetical protein
LNTHTCWPGGARDMNNRYRDAMATVRRYGKPSFFITMTCNPDWSVRGHRASKRALKTTNCRIFLSLPIKLALARWQVCASIRAATYLYKYVYKGPPHDLDRSQVRPLGDARPPSVPCVAPATFGPFSQQFWNLWPELPPDLPTVLPVHPTSVDHQAPSFFTPTTRNPDWPATSDDPQRGQQRFHRYRAPLHQRVRGRVRARTGGGWRSAWPGWNFVSESYTLAGLINSCHIGTSENVWPGYKLVWPRTSEKLAGHRFFRSLRLSDSRKLLSSR